MVNGFNQMAQEDVKERKTVEYQYSLRKVDDQMEIDNGTHSPFRGLKKLFSVHESILF